MKNKLFAFWKNIYFQNLLSDSWYLDELHSKVISMQIMITILTGGVIYMSLLSHQINKIYDEWMGLEILWTIAPGLVLIWLGMPSLALLYQQESLHFQTDVISKVMGHQWYWEYNLPELEISFDSITSKSSDIFPLGDSDARLTLPFWKNILFLVSSTDVIHSFALPGLGVKADANPGRLNSINTLSKAPGWFVGQCSELCGSLHSNMTISLEFTSSNLFLEWASLRQD